MARWGWECKGGSPYWPPPRVGEEQQGGNVGRMKRSVSGKLSPRSHGPLWERILRSRLPYGQVSGLGSRAFQGVGKGVGSGMHFHGGPWERVSGSAVQTTDLRA